MSILGLPYRVGRFKVKLKQDIFLRNSGDNRMKKQLYLKSKIITFSLIIFRYTSTVFLKSCKCFLNFCSRIKVF